MTTQPNGKRVIEAVKPSQATMNGSAAMHEGTVSSDLHKTECLHTVAVILTDEDLTLLEQIGQGSCSEGIRLALRAWRRESAARLSAAVRIAAEIQADPASLVSHEDLQRRLAEKTAALHAVAP